MSASIRIKYIGTDPDPDIHFTFDQVYQVLATTADGGSVLQVVLNDIGKLQSVTTGASNSNFELVSITYPGEVQIYP